MLFSLILSKTIIDISNYHYYENTLNFTVEANLTKYLNLLSKNNSEIENKTIYSSYKELKEVKIAVLEGTIFKKFSENLNLNFQISEYKSRKEIIDSLRNKKIEAYITTLEEAKNIIMHNNDISYINIDDNQTLQDYQYSFVTKNESKNILSTFQYFYSNYYYVYYEVNYDWNGFDESLSKINKTSRSDDISKKIKIGLRMDNIPFSYNNSKGELTGYTINHFYSTFGNIELLEFKSNEELIEAVQNGTVNISAGYFSEKENKNKNYTDIYFLYSEYKLTPVAVIRYENSNSSKVWKINSSIKDFKNSKILNQSLPNHLYISLLKEEVDAILIEEPIAEYYSKHFDKLTYFSESISNISYGFRFINETLKHEFNEFLSKNYNEDQFNKILDNWINNDNYEIDKNLLNLDGTRGTIRYLLDSDKKPIAFLENGMPKGFELELLYKFAKEYDYKIKYCWTSTLIGPQDYIWDVNLGGLDVNNSFVVKDTFSNPIYKSSIVLAVKTKNKKDNLTIQVLDKDYNYKSNNDLQILTRVLYQDKNASCIFPKEYNDTILINCSVSDFDYNINGTITGVDFLNTSDLIKITYSTIKPDNFLNADLIFKEDFPENIDNEPSDKVIDKETDKYNDKFNDKETDKNKEANEKKEDEDESKNQINNGGKSSDKNSLSLAVIISIVATVVLILLIIIII